MDDISIAEALDTHFGYAGAVDILIAALDMHTETLHALLTEPYRVSSTD